MLPTVQASSAGESLSTLAFGARVSEITLGRATRNCESSAVFEARQALQQCGLCPVYSAYSLCNGWLSGTWIAGTLLLDGSVPVRANPKPWLPWPDASVFDNAALRLQI